jgi:hypothetical protein
MGKILVTFFLLFSMTVQSQDNRQIFFAKPLEGKNYDLTKILGEAFEVMYKERESIIVVKYDSIRRVNVITNSCSDTLFFGKVFKTGNLFFLQRILAEDRYQITALCLGKNSVRGLVDIFDQNILLIRWVRSGKYKELIMSESTSEVRLQPKVNFMEGMYNELLDQFDEAYYTRSFLPCSKDGSDYCN